MTKYSLKTNFLLTALVAIGISHALTSWRLYQTQLRETWLEDHRNKSWPDPTKISVISLAAPSTNYTMIPTDWEWRVMLPGDIQYSLNIDFGVGVSRSLTSTMEDDINTITVPLPRGTSLLSVQMNPQGTSAIGIAVSIDGVKTERVLEDSCGFFDPENGFMTTKCFITHTMGISQTQTEEPLTPVMLAFRAATNSKSDADAGIRVWIGPDPGDPTEPSVATKPPR